MAQVRRMTPIITASMLAARFLLPRHTEVMASTIASSNLYKDMGSYPNYQLDVRTLVGDSLPSSDWAFPYFHPDKPVSRIDFVEALATIWTRIPWGYSWPNHLFPKSDTYSQQVYQVSRNYFFKNKSWFDDKDKTIANPNGKVTWADASAFIVNVLQGPRAAKIKAAAGRNNQLVLEKLNLNQRIPNWGKSNVVTRLDAAVLAENTLYLQTGRLFPTGSRLVFIGQPSVQQGSMENPQLDVVDKYGNIIPNVKPPYVLAHAYTQPVGVGTVSPDIEFSDVSAADQTQNQYQFVKTGTFSFTGKYADIPAEPYKVTVGTPNITHVGSNYVPTVQVSNHVTRNFQLGLPSWDHTLDFESNSTSPDPDDLKANSNVVSVNQAVYVTSDGKEADSSSVWSVNSPDAVITPGPILDGGKSISATFVAQKPGIYTVSSGSYPFQPIYIVVGLSRLQYIPYRASASNSGILPLPSSLHKSKTIHTDVLDFTKYAGLSNGFVPVRGVIHRRTVSSVTVTIGSSTPNQWSYQIPVDRSGHFGALLRTLMGGASVPVQITLNGPGKNIPSKPFLYRTLMYTYPLSSQQKALLASSRVPFNLNSDYAQVAAHILENSDTTDTAIRAIVAYVNHTSGYHLATSIRGTHLTPADVTAANLRAVGIPAQVNIPDPSNTHDEAWLEVWNGDLWTPVYPSSSDTSFEIALETNSTPPGYSIGAE